MALGTSGDAALAYFYFDYREQDGQTPNAFVACLLRQIALQKVDFPQSLLDFYEHYRNERAQAATDDLFATFRQVYTSFEKCYIVIDALDECRSSIYRKEILKILSGLDLEIVRLFVTSRPHVHDIRQNFLHAQQIEIEASEQDVKSYCHRMIEDNQSTLDLIDNSLKEEVANAVAKNAQGMYVAHPICTCRQQRPSLHFSTAFQISDQPNTGSIHSVIAETF